MLHSRAITSWIVKHINGGIKYKSATGHIEVKRKGYYYIYSQMYYYGDTTILVGHGTFINHKKVMESSGSVSSSQKYNTKYHGGVFLLQEGDVISVQIPFISRFFAFLDSEGSFFGAFLLKSAAIQGKQMYFFFTKCHYDKHNIINVCKTLRSLGTPLPKFY